MTILLSSSSTSTPPHKVNASNNLSSPSTLLEKSAGKHENFDDKQIKKSAVDFLKDKSLPWSSEKIKDELYLQLISITINGESKYEKQAKDLIYRIPVYRPTPNFIINLSDLSEPLIKEISRLSDKDLEKIIKEVLSALYESIDKDYFLLSIKKCGLIQWRIER